MVWTILPGPARSPAQVARFTYTPLGQGAATLAVVQPDTPGASYSGVSRTTSLSEVGRPPLIGVRSTGQDDTAAIISVRQRSTIRSPGFDGAGSAPNSPSGRGGVFMKMLI